MSIIPRSLWPRSLWIALIAALLALDGARADWNGRTRGEVDLLLVIALDVSGSVDAVEFDLQREGLARALESPQVAEAIAGGVNGSIAVIVVQWSGFLEQTVKIDWMRLSNLGALSRLAEEVRRMRRRYDDGATDIGGAIEYCQRLIAAAPISGTRRVIDIAGDGANNVNYSPHLERDRVVELGITINALAIGVIGSGTTADTTSTTTSTTTAASTTSPGLADYYRERVIGGAGAFVEMAADYGAFERAMRRKLLREIGGPLLF